MDNPTNPRQRRSIRLPGYDYSAPGMYFVTICTQHQHPVFGSINDDGELFHNTLGCIALECWEWLAEQYAYVQLDAYVLMPDHLHGIIVLTDEEERDIGRGGSRTARRTAPRTAPTSTQRKPLGRLIGAFKTVSTKRINNVMGTPGARLWQRNYYERIIRNEKMLNNVRRYIIYNPTR